MYGYSFACSRSNVSCPARLPGLDAAARARTPPLPASPSSAPTYPPTQPEDGPPLPALKTHQPTGAAKQPTNPAPDALQVWHHTYSEHMLYPGYDPQDPPKVRGTCCTLGTTPRTPPRCAVLLSFSGQVEVVGWVGGYTCW
jgi:hypothetical protein